jgi:tetratricopeptide (TPR) repeat protein
MDSKNADAYYQRAICYLGLLPGEIFEDRYLDNVYQAIQDIDQAINLQTDVGDYYWNRGRAYEYLSYVMEFDVDRIYLKSIMLENYQKAISLGTNLSEFPERAVILALIFIHQCDEALEKIDPLLAELVESDFNRGGLLRIKSQTFACLGRLPEAIDSIDAAMFNNIDLPSKKFLKSIYLYQLGQYESAYDLIDGVINAAPRGDGERYYLRAALEYELGNLDFARRDLETGMGFTWLHFGLLQYVESQMALDAGEMEQAIALLQYSEATLDSIFTPLRAIIRKQLDDMGATLLNPTSSVTFTVTPIT